MTFAEFLMHFVKIVLKNRAEYGILYHNLSRGGVSVTDKKLSFMDLFKAFGVKQNRNDRVKMLNLCISIDLIFSFSVFGYISLSNIAATTVHIPVLIAAMLVGPWGGTLTGLIFGLTSMWKASTTATAYADIIFSPWKSGNQIGSLILCIGTRMLFGFIAGLLFSCAFRRAKRQLFAPLCIVVSIVSTMLHSMMVSASMKVFFPQAGAGILSAVELSVRHIAVWAVTALLVFAAYRFFIAKGFMNSYKEVIEYKHDHKTGGGLIIIVVMVIFFLISSAIILHTFDKLLIFDIKAPIRSVKRQSGAMNIAFQQLVAQLGTIYIISLIMSFFYDRNAIATDKLHEKEQQALFQEKLQRTLDVMQALSRDYDLVLSTDLDEDRTTVYRCSEEIRGLLPEESEGVSYEQWRVRFFTGMAAKDELAELLELSDRKNIEEYLNDNSIFARVFKNRQGRFAEAKIVPISSHELVFGYTDVDKVIRQQMKQQEELEQAMRAAEEASKAKSAFLLNMSHDIRTPMNAIIGYTDVLEKYRQDEEKFGQCTQNIRASGQYLMDLMNNVLEMARIESGVEELNDETPCDVLTVLKNTFVVFEEEAKRQGKSFTHEGSVQHYYIYADKIKIQQIHLNIVSNAIKYTPKGGSIKVSTVELPCERKGWCLIQTRTSDTGVGMSKEFVEHIFEDFAREKDSNAAGAPGTGLGMGIVKKLVEMMNGTVAIESEKGKGTTVCVTIPHRIASAEDIGAEGSQQSADTSLLKGKRILLAEDNDINAEIAAELLSDVGLEVDRAEDGIICVSKLETAEAGYYDMILMDVQMPNMDGYQATAVIRGLADRKKAGIPIIAMTANAFARDRQQALAAGMNEHISKPISITKLVSVIARFL